MRLHVVIAAAFWCGFVDSRKIRGISSSYKRFYRERKSFLCIDGSKIIPFEQVNDDYCDCEDGSDEPGTSACPRGRFYCTNLGFRPHYIPSSRVNDGICAFFKDNRGSAASAAVMNRFILAENESPSSLFKIAGGKV